MRGRRKFNVDHEDSCFAEERSTSIHSRQLDALMLLLDVALKNSVSILYNEQRRSSHNR